MLTQEERQCVGAMRGEPCELRGGMRAVEGAAGGPHARTRFTAHMFDRGRRAIGRTRSARATRRARRRAGRRRRDGGRGEGSPSLGRKGPLGTTSPGETDGVGLCNTEGSGKGAGLEGYTWWA